MNTVERETFSSRLGFILISAGCAIGLGNVWRFPYITGKYGGAAFVLIYLAFLIFMGLPLLVMELAVGRGSRRSIARCFDVLEKPGQKWHWVKYVAIAGNYVLMMFYAAVAGWMLLYFWWMARGVFDGLDAEGVANQFYALMARPGLMVLVMVITVTGCFLICAMGLRKGVEKVTKWMMVALFALIVVLAVNSLTLEGAGEGIRFYLMPDFTNLTYDAEGNFILSEAIFAAMGQAFFTLGLGVGSIGIFGSYIERDRSLTGEAVTILVLDTFIAVVAGLIIFPACSAFGVAADNGPPLIFITLPNVFNHMTGGRLWGTLFFLFMSFAALSTVIAVFENIVSICSELTHAPRKKVSLVNIPVMILLCLPCILGFNLWSGFQPFGPGSTIQDLEDFIVSNTILPIGTCVYVLFCTHKSGWGYENFLREANAGEGLKLPRGIGFYLKWILPVIILVIFLQGYWDKFL